jgi:hypothetical protein
LGRFLAEYAEDPKVTAFSTFFNEQDLEETLTAEFRKPRDQISFSFISKKISENKDLWPHALFLYFSQEENQTFIDIFDKFSQTVKIQNKIVDPSFWFYDFEGFEG